MRKHIGLAAAAALVVSLFVGVVTAGAGGGNSPNAKACQKGGWTNVVREDETAFGNQGECVSYAARGGALMPIPTTCTAGSEDFSGDANGSRPTTFAGGVIDGPYALIGQIRIQGYTWGGNFPNNTHVLDIGFSRGPFRLTFTNAVRSVRLDAQHANFDNEETQTLTAYDVSDNPIASDSATVTSAVTPLVVTAPSNNIKYFTLTTTDFAGLAFSNVMWDCAGA